MFKEWHVKKRNSDISFFTELSFKYETIPNPWDYIEEENDEPDL